MIIKVNCTKIEWTEKYTKLIVTNKYQQFIHNKTEKQIFNNCFIDIISFNISDHNNYFLYGEICGNFKNVIFSINGFGIHFITFHNVEIS